MIQNYDLFACEARYHPKWRKDYTRDPSAWKSKNPEKLASQQNLQEAHQFAFDHIANYIHNTMVKTKKIVTLSFLRLMYTMALDDTGFPNDEYKSIKLRQKIENHPDLGSKVTFTKIDSKGNFPFYLVYNSSITTEEAIQ
ncbi:hypothetical protein ElyMa_006502100 [Elysia marginata]|uniref:Uncharacterized protein n=1 Tax=Elysia marginata TaxID=1093978 RepID=A0AAV4I3C7_9GAST|nr:hypothetical protein ElyMa_006502100 [Elysia marginata]